MMVSLNSGIKTLNSCNFIFSLESCNYLGLLSHSKSGFINSSVNSCKLSKPFELLKHIFEFCLSYSPMSDYKTSLVKSGN